MLSAHRVVSEAVTVGLFCQSRHTIVSNASEKRRGAPCQTIARLLEHRRGRGSSRLKVGARRAGQSAGPQALLRVPSARIGQAESSPERGL